ncbi:hypothetical protein [Halarcobacter ebronensis]|nr:hypothetical protein [Halarcobacter ebronensis]
MATNLAKKNYNIIVTYNNSKEEVINVKEDIEFLSSMYLKMLPLLRPCSI